MDHRRKLKKTRHHLNHRTIVLLKMNGRNDWVTKPVLVHTTPISDITSNDSSSEHFGLTDEYELLYRVHQVLHRDKTVDGRDESKKNIFQNHDHPGGDAGIENDSPEIFDHQHSTSNAHVHQPLNDQHPGQNHPSVDNGTEHHRSSKIKLPPHLLNHLIASSSASAPSSPLLQRARRLAFINPCSSGNNGKSRESLTHQSLQPLQQHQRQRQHQRLDSTNDSNGETASTHTANVYQVDGRKRSVSYSNFSNFYE